MLPLGLMVEGVKCRPGLVEFRQDRGSFLPFRKVATVFEDPAIQASSAKLVRGSTREFSVYGEGFNKVVKPILEFDPPLHAEAVTTHVSGNRIEVYCMGFNRYPCGFSGRLQSVVRNMNSEKRLQPTRDVISSRARESSWTGQPDGDSNNGSRILRVKEGVRRSATCMREHGIKA